MSRDPKLPASREVDSFLEQVRARPPVTGGRRGRLLFALDATASRQPTWDLACTLQGDMFTAADAVGGLDLELCFYRGFRDFRHSGWVRDGQALAERMNRVRCLGGQTQIERVLRHALEETRRERIQAVVFVGDCIEEEVDRLCELSGQLGLLGTPLFVFHEGRDGRARAGFTAMARASGGACVPFSIDSAARLKELLEAVAVFASGGQPALEDFARSRRHAAALLADLRLSATMVIRLLLLFLLALFTAALLRLLWLRYRPPPRQLLAAAGIATGLILLLALVATGRLHWIAAVLATLIPLAFKLLAAIGLWRILGGGPGGIGSGGPRPFPGGSPTGQQSRSEVTTRFLRMGLDHASGRLEGSIVEGPEAGRSLDELGLARLLELLQHYQVEDPDSARLLETFLDRSHGPGWREAAKGAASGTSGGPLTRADALRVLGLAGEPGRDEIIRAHRRMMQKFHPDHGGSEDLAARINAAKDRLLDDLP